MKSDIKILSKNVNSSINATQAHIQGCIQAIEQKNKEDFKAHAKALKNEVEQLSTLLKPVLQDIKNSLHNCN